MADNRQSSFAGPQTPSNEPNTVSVPTLNDGILQNQEVIENNHGARINVSQSEGLGPNVNENSVKLVGPSSGGTFIPVVSDSMRPMIGMEFDTIEAAYNFYNLYAKEAGFSVRKSSAKKNANGNVRHKLFVCAKEGKTDKKASNHGLPLKRTVPETRVGCKACMSVKLCKTKGPTYTILGFVEEHTHLLTAPQKTHLLRSHRKVANSKKKVVNTFEGSSIQPSQQMIVCEGQSGGYGNVGCIDQDVHNYARDKREEKKGLDAQMLYDYFQDMAVHNCSFLYTVKKDGENKITHVFWADGNAKTNYSKFGTVVSFDIAYQTNCYNMIFVSFMGLNHHGRSVVLGCGFLSRDIADDFVWLLEEWQKAMRGDPPKSIVTDQDPDMTKAIARVFPNAIHCYCLWHIMDKVPKNLGLIAFRADFNVAFNDVVYNPETPDEFEERWPIFLEKFELTKNEWLHDMYELRSRWIPAYLRHHFFAGIRSTKCSEINKFLKHVHRNSSFRAFMLRYERFIGHQRHRELRDGHETLNGKPKLKTPISIEAQMADIYTRKVFLKFQEELFYSLVCKVVLQSENDSESYFVVSPQARRIYEDCVHKTEKRYDKPRKVVLQRSTSYATCSCHKFEFEGIPCRHVLSVLVKHVGIDEMPHQFILERWTRYAKQGDVIDKNGALVKAIGDESLVSRHTFLLQLSESCSTEGCLTKEAFHHTVDVLSCLQKELREINHKMGAIMLDNNKKGKQVANEVEYHEHRCCLSKGCGKRLKPMREKVHKKTFLCHGCDYRGVSHGKCNCSTLENSCLQRNKGSPVADSDDSSDIDGQESEDESDMEMSIEYDSSCD